jgi:hypothetical protein
MYDDVPPTTVRHGWWDVMPSRPWLSKNVRRVPRGKSSTGPVPVDQIAAAIGAR